MASFNNISLYIKRADLYQTKEYITNIFETNNIGIVKDVKFIKKTDNVGREYNGAIVIFASWFMNAKVRQLLEEMGTSGTSKFMYDCNGHYWFINVYKPVMVESEEFAIVDPGLPDKERIDELEKLVKSMAAQMHYTQLRQERTESLLMAVEEKASRQVLLNMEMRFKLEDKDMAMEWAKQDNEKALKESQDEIDKLKSRLESLSLELVKKEEELKGQMYCPIVSEMSKMTIDELI